MSKAGFDGVQTGLGGLEAMSKSIMDNIGRYHRQTPDDKRSLLPLKLIVLLLTIDINFKCNPRFKFVSRKLV